MVVVEKPYTDEGHVSIKLDLKRGKVLKTIVSTHKRTTDQNGQCNREPYLPLTDRYRNEGECHETNGSTSISPT